MDIVLHLTVSIIFTMLSYFSLSECNIGSIDSEVFNQLKSIQTLDLSQNCLTGLPCDLHLPSLQTLDLSYNQLESVDFVSQFDKLQQLYLEDNDALKVSKKQFYWSNFYVAWYKVAATYYRDHFSVICLSISYLVQTP